MTVYRFDILIAVLALFATATIRSSAQSPAATGSSPAAPPNGAALNSLIATYAASWGEPDRAAREQLLERVFEGDGTYTDPTAELANRTALVEHIEQFLKRSPGAKIQPTSVVDAHHGTFRFSWRMVLPGGQAPVDGVDFGEVSPGGKIKRIVGFFGPLVASR